MAGTNELGQVFYNGFKFPVARKYKCTGTPVVDSTGRNVKYVAWTIFIQGVIDPSDFSPNPAGTADIPTEDLRVRLTKPGQRLDFEAVGFGNPVLVNTNAKNIDVQYGPIPRLLQWEPVGGNRAVRITWICDVHLAECGDNVSAANLLEFAYEEDWDIQEDGMQTRTINGNLEVPAWRIPTNISLQSGGNSRAANLVLFSADTRRDLLRFRRLKNFRRRQRFRVSKDKRTLSFSFIDSEIPSDNPFFPGTVNVDANMRVRSGLAEGFRDWTVSITGSTEVLAGVQKSIGWLALITIVSHKLQLASSGQRDDPDTESLEGDRNQDKQRESKWIPLSIDIEESLHRRRITFAFTYRLITSLKNILRSAGMFQPLPANTGNWDLWSAKLDEIIGTRGVAQLGNLPGNDLIIDVCSGLAPPFHANGYRVPTGLGSSDPFDVVPPKAEDTYIHYENDVELESDERTFEHVPLEEVSPLQEEKQITPEIQNFVPLPNTKKTDAVTSGLQNEGILQSVCHKTSKTTYRVVMKGTAARVGLPPSPPSLVSFGGITAVKTGRDVVKRKTLSTGSKGFTIYLVSWRKRYIIPSKPKDGSYDTDAEVGKYV